MPTIAETLGAAGTPLHDALMAGISDISQQTTVVFTTYAKRVLPLDGFVFWLRSGQFEASGSLHWASVRQQTEDETATENTVVLTTGTEIQALNQTNTQILCVSEVEGRKYAFGQHGFYFEPADVWHYQGVALHPVIATQLVDDPRTLDPSKLIVSDSLPAWLTLARYSPIWLQPLNPGIPLYPSFLVPDNMEPPFGSVHIEPADIRALQPIPSWDRTMTQTQLTEERVRVTLYGCNNDMAEDFLALVLNYSRDTDMIGIMGGTTTVRDDKRPWPEGMVIAQKKVIDFQISYIQKRVNDLARQLIEDASAFVSTWDLVGPRSHLFVGAHVAVNARVLRPYQIDTEVNVSVVPSVTMDAVVNISPHTG